jgi:hypothetical protein
MAGLTLDSGALIGLERRHHRIRRDQPFKVATQPYPPLPAVFPSYCAIGPRAGDGGAI